MIKGRTLTQADVDYLKQELREDFPTKQDFEEFKSSFFDKIDPILKEVVAKREERVIRAEQIRRHEDRISNLEKIHPQGKHPATV